MARRDSPYTLARDVPAVAKGRRLTNIIPPMEHETTTAPVAPAATLSQAQRFLARYGGGLPGAAPAEAGTFAE